MDPVNEIIQNNREEPLSPALMHTPLYDPYYPEHSHQLSLQMPCFAFGPLLLVPVNDPAEFWFNPYSFPPSLVFLPEVHHNWCPVHSHQPGNPELVSGRAPQQVSEQLNATPALSGNEQIKEKPKSEEEELQENKPDKDKLQTNIYIDNETKSEFPPGSLTSLDEEELAKQAFEEYMTIMDSLCPEVQPEGDKDEQTEKLERDSLLEYMEKLCSENFIRNVEATLDVEFLNSFLSVDPEPAQLLTMENQEQRVKLQEHPPSADIQINPGTEETSMVESTLNTDYLDLSLISDLERIDFPPLIKLQQEALDLIPEQYSQLPSADSNSDPVTDAASTATSRVEETAPLQRAQSPIFDRPGTKSDTKPNHDGRDAPLSMSSIEPLPTDALRKYYNSVDAMSPLYYDGSIFKDYNQSLQFLENMFSDDSPTSALEARGNDGLVEEPAAIIPTGDVSEETSMSLSNLAGTQSPQMSQKLEGGPQPGDPPASESPSTTSVSGANDDPHAMAVDDPVPSFRADLLTVTPTLPASPPAQSVQASPPAQIKEPEEQHSPKIINLKSPCLEDYPTPEPTNSSFVADSLAESCDPPIDASLSDSVSVEQSVELPKQLQASPEKELKGTTNKVQTRRNQRPTDQTEQEKARLTDEFIIERTEKSKPSEKSAKKTAKLTPQSDGVMYKKQKRRSYRGRQLFQREESHFEERSQATKTANTAEQFSQIGEVEQHQNLAGQVQTLNVDGGEKCEANNSNLGTQIGTENALLIKMTQEEKVERLKNKEEVQRTSFVRITRSQSLTLITEERVQQTTCSVARTRGKVKHSEMDRSTIKSSPKTDIQDDKQKKATELQTLPVSTQVSTKDKVSVDCSPVRLTKCSLQAQRVRMNTRSQKDSIKGDQSRQESHEGLPIEINESPSVKSSDKETRQQSKTVASSEGGVMGTVTRDFYSLRSKTHKPNVSKGTEVQENKAAEARQPPSNPEPSPEQTAGVKAEDGRDPVLTSGQMKRYRHECGASEETESMVNIKITLSPTKRGRWKKRAEVNSKRDEGKDEVETAFHKTSPPSTQSQRKAGLRTPSAHDGGKRSVMETRTSRRPSRHGNRLPTKYKDFILLKTNRHKRQLDEGKRKKTLRGGKAS